MIKIISRHLIFAIYSWIIASTYLFFCLPWCQNVDDFFYTYGYILFYKSFVLTVGVVFMCLREIIYPTELLKFLICLPGSILYAVPWILWWKKQTLIRAGFVAFISGISAPGLDTLQFDMPGTISYGAVYWLIPSFYYFLVFLDINRKESFSESKICNAIVNILKWPCLRT